MHENPLYTDLGLHRATLEDIHRPPSQIEDAISYVARLLDQLRAEPSGLILIHDLQPRPEQIPIPSAGIVVGRSTQAGYRAAEDASDGTISGMHFRVFEDEGHIWVEDLGSTNGTWVGANPVTRCILRTGDIVRAGNQRFVFIDHH